MKLNPGLNAIKILKKLLKKKKKLLKTANLRTQHRGNSLTELSMNGLGEMMGRLRK